MPTAEIISEDLIRSLATNTSAVSNAQKISKTGGFLKLCRSEDNTLIFGECKGSGKNPYYTSADFSGDAPVFRCSCPSRQCPCKHSLAIMFDWLAGKNFTVEDIPEDIIKKRKKIEKKKNASAEDTPKKRSTNKSAVTKKLKKQLEGLKMAESFVKDILDRGISSITPVSAPQYESLAKQLGDYYLPEPQTIVYEIVNSAKILSAKPDDDEVNRIVSLCIKLHSTIKKSTDYINQKLESGEVLPEDNILYEAMGGVWKLTQLRDIGLFKENARIIQLSFSVFYDSIHKASIDWGYWIDIDSGEISKTKNIRPLRIATILKEEDSSFGLHSIKELFYYPGRINKRIRWENAEISDANSEIYDTIISKAEKSISEAVKKAKNELKNTLSDSFTAVLIPFEKIEFAVSDGHPVLKYNSETIALKSNENYPETCSVLSVTDSKFLKDATLFGELFYKPSDRKIYLCPISIINHNGIIRLS